MIQRSGILCAGNWIVDIVHEIEHWPLESDLVRIQGQEMGLGGGPANVISALARLETGLPLWPMGAIGEDAFGQFILTRCKELGFSTDLMILKPDTPTAHTHVMSVPGKTRTFFYQGGANDCLSEQDFPPGLFRTNRAQIFYLGYPTLLKELDRIGPDGTAKAGEILARATAAGMTTCVDLVSIDRPDFANIVAGSLPNIDYLILNEVELARAGGHAPVSSGETPEDQDIIAMAQTVLEKGVRKAVIAHCPQKALWVGADGQMFGDPVVPLPQNEVASSLGAGDSFCAGVLYGLHENWSAQKALKLGHAVASASLRGVTATEAIPSLSKLMHLV